MTGLLLLRDDRKCVPGLMNSTLKGNPAYLCGSFSSPCLRCPLRWDNLAIKNMNLKPGILGHSLFKNARLPGEELVSARRGARSARRVGTVSKTGARSARQGGARSPRRGTRSARRGGTTYCSLGECNEIGLKFSLYLYLSIN
ncbi:hypothetical protein AVEN_223990-1 [Araneus ventricosus]|uniref:Uncharacterized protein n=1 Tax=Araneus ventricosus TaxID=182803 RepID=A0A4Y2L4E4_ARAVE|nr:hypothetical protein AVEN_223990-1 [Araneus ventricosus]